MSEGALVAFGLGTGAIESSIAVAGVWTAVGLSTAGFAMALAALEARRGRLLLHRPSGSYDRIPLLATAFVVLGLASVGLPGTFGFVAEDLLFGAAIGDHPWLTMALIASTGLNAMAVMRIFFFLFMGRGDHDGERDLVFREWLALTLLLAALVIEGLFPRATLDWLPGSRAMSEPFHALTATTMEQRNRCAPGLCGRASQK
jgi:NADH:ubiquinone oxidoreductase subunit 4 (subunit M)